MGNEIFVIGDTHFGHKKILEFEAEFRPFDSIEQHDEELVRRWNDEVRPKDTVIHLGDVLFGLAAFSILPRLNGIKKLVLGNHDRYPTEDYLAHFSKVYGSYEYKDVVLTHIPIHPMQFYRYRMNVHGHTHSRCVFIQDRVFYDRRYFNASAERISLTPIRLRNIIRYKGIREISVRGYTIERRTKIS